MVLGASRKTRTRTLMERCGWFYFSELVRFHSLILMYKIVNIGTPENLRNKLTLSPDKRIVFSPGRLKISRDAFKLRTSQAWNELPDYLLELDKISTFKKGLKRFIIESQTGRRAETSARSGLTTIYTRFSKTTFSHHHSTLSVLLPLSQSPPVSSLSLNLPNPNQSS